MIKFYACPVCNIHQTCCIIVKLLDGFDLLVEIDGIINRGTKYNIGQELIEEKTIIEFMVGACSRISIIDDEIEFNEEYEEDDYE